MTPRRIREIRNIEVSCAMLDGGLATVQADGTFVICCMDGANETVFGTVFDAPETFAAPLRPWRLCATCWQRPPEQ